jgi:ABC-type multidrug transport system ATPase subunit
MKLLLEWDSDSIILEQGSSYVLGRDESCDILINSAKISRAHLRLTFQNNKWLVTDLDTTNGTFLRGKRIESTVISSAIKLNLGGLDLSGLTLTPLSGSTTQTSLKSLDGQATKISRVRKQESEPADDLAPRRVRLQQRIKIGRDSDNDWFIDDINVSRFHAEVVQNSIGGFDLVDLRSTNGTFLNGDQIKREPLKIGDVIQIGKYSRRFTQDGLQVLEGIDGTPVATDGVTFEIAGRNLLQDVSFTLGPRTLTAIVGPSGAGKSTLLGVLTGRTKPTQGSVFIGGVNLHSQFQVLSRQIGSVPQSDILHTRLTVRQALTYGAELRLPNDTNRTERHARVTDVMKKLELTERADLRIDKLSGGQRKRASIGLELLTSPQLLVLDEPTSGLDPGLDAHVMEMLRTLADDGQTVVLVTHSVDNLNFCDNVILLASGGKVAYAGPSATVFSKLGKKSWAEVFRFLATPDALLLSTQKYKNPLLTEIHDRHMMKKKQSILKQIKTLSSRYLRVIISDRFYLALLTLIPVVIGIISYSAGSKYGFGLGKELAGGATYNPYAQGTILVLILGTIFIGLSTGIQEIVKENAIRKREQSVGIRSRTYLLSKVLVLGLIVILQTLVFTTIVLFGRQMPARGVLIDSSRLEINFLSISLSITSMVLGLLISTFLTSSEQAMPTLVGMTMVQVVLSGALPLDTSGVISQISQIIPSYWITNGFAASVNLVQLARIENIDLQQRWKSEAVVVSQGFIAMGIFCALFLSLALIKIRRSR